MLILTLNLIDDTGMSYYGKNNIYIFNMNIKELKLVDTYLGPIHDCAWNHSSTEFVVLSGYMPAHSVLYDRYTGAKFQFGVNHRNSLFWSPLRRFLAIAGVFFFEIKILVWKFER